MKAQKSFTKHNTQLNGSSARWQIDSSASSLSEARELGFIDYKFADVELNYSPIIRAETFGKLEVRTTYEFYNDIYLAFDASKSYKLNLFSDKLFEENGIFRLESICCESAASNEIPFFSFVFNYRVTSDFIKQVADIHAVDLIIAKLINDMCKVCINSTLEGGYKDEDYSYGI